MAAPAVKTLNIIEMQRVSSDRQDVARQEYDLAENREQFPQMNVLRTIRLKISGTKVLTNEDVQQMIASLESSAADGISISAIDRLFRPKDFEGLLMLQYFHKHQKVIVSTKEGYVEPWTDRGWETCMTAATKAGSELRELKRRTKGGRRKRQAEKKMCQTTAPYGMAYVSKYERDAEGRSQYLTEDLTPSSLASVTKREVVQMVFSWRFHNKLRIGTIKTKLNKMGILTAGKKGQYEPGAWSRQTVRQMLLNRKYIGEHVEGDVTMPCPKFIERDVFDGVQEMFKKEKEMSNGRPATKHLLCGWLRCKGCGRRHRTETSSRGRGSYVCGNFDYRLGRQVCKAPSRVKCETLEEIVWAAIWLHLTEPELLLSNARAYYDSLPSKSSTAKLEAELTTVRSRIERTRRMVKLGTEDEDKGNAEILEDKRRVVAIESQLRAAESVMTLPKAHIVKAGCERIATAGALLETFDERRPILEKLVNLKIVYGEGEVEITGKVPVPEVVEASGGSDRKCNRGFSEACGSDLYIPFRIKERAA